MPGKMSPKKEKLWDESKAIVRKEKGKSQKKFKDRDWGLVTHIFKLKKKKHLGKGKKKKAAVNVTIEPFEPLVDKAIALIESKSSGYLTNAGIHHVVVESGDPGHFGKAESDKPDTIFIAAEKIKTMLGGSPDDEEAVVRQIALTIAHEVGHHKSKFQGGEAPAEAEGKTMESKISEIQDRSKLRKQALHVQAAGEDKPSPAPVELPPLVSPEQLSKMERRIKQLQNQLLALAVLIKNMQQSPEEFRNFSPDALRSEIAKKRELLNTRLTEQKQLQEVYSRLNPTGEEVDVSEMSAPQMPLERGRTSRPSATRPAGPAGAGNKSAPIREKAPAEVQPTEVGEAYADISDIEKLLTRVRRNVVRRVISGSAEHPSTFTAPQKIVGIKIMDYMLGKGPALFLEHGETYHLMGGERGNDQIKNEIDQRLKLATEYLTILEQDHSAFQHAKHTGRDPNAGTRIRVRGPQYSGEVPATDVVGPADMPREVDLPSLREKVNHDAHRLEMHIERSIKSILPYVFSPSKPEVGSMRTQLSPEDQAASTRALYPDPLQKIKPLSDQLPGASYHGLDKMYQSIALTPGRPTAEPPPPPRKDEMTEWELPVDPGSRRTEKAVTLPNQPKQKRPGFKPLMDEHTGKPYVLPRAPKKSSAGIPLAKTGASKKPPDWQAPGKFEEKMLEKGRQEMRQLPPDAQINRALIPEHLKERHVNLSTRPGSSTMFGDINEVLKHWAADLAEYWANHSQEEVGGQADFADRLPELYRYRDAWKVELKAIGRKKIDKAQREAAKKKIDELEREIKRIEGMIAGPREFMAQRRTNIPTQETMMLKRRPMFSETFPGIPKKKDF